MKIVKIAALLMLLPLFAAEAKYKYPEGATTATERKVNRRLNHYDADKSGNLSLDEYKKFREVRTRDDRRQERKERKKGVYVSPENAFEQMDANGDGVVSREEMLEYERMQIKE